MHLQPGKASQLQQSSGCRVGPSAFVLLRNTGAGAVSMVLCLVRKRCTEGGQYREVK
jgi:hypothetical protein